MSKRHHISYSYSSKHPLAGQSLRQQKSLESPRRWSEQETWRKVWQIAVLVVFVTYVVVLMIWR